MAKKHSSGVPDTTESCQGETASNINTPVITSINADTPACKELMDRTDVKVGKKRYRASVQVRDLTHQVMYCHHCDAYKRATPT